ncbi:hypothetical protein Tco_0630716, partial [Tanacetum coccineum]
MFQCQRLLVIACICLEGEGNAIQANMNVSDIEYFSQILEVAAGFPDHFFNFVLYNQLDFNIPQLDSQSRLQHPVLTGYIGCVRSVGALVISGDPNKRQTIRRKVDIENLEHERLDMCTDIAKISRKRSKPDKHGHGNEIECARARRMLSK